MRLLVLTLCLLVTAASHAGVDKLKPTFTKVPLKEFTTLSLDIMPDTGTQLVFPFLLDNPELTPSLKIRLTNSDGFEVPHEKSTIEALLKGQNTITILGKPSEGNSVFVGNLFISIGGYNLSIALRTTYDIHQHQSNIVFEIEDDKRDHLIENVIARKSQELEKRYQKRVEELDKQAIQQSLRHVATMAREKPEFNTFKFDDDIELGDVRLVIYVDRIASYGDQYHILLFEVENHTNDDIKLSSITLNAQRDKVYTALLGDVSCPELIKADSTVRCSFATTNALLGEAKELKLVFATDHGIGEIVW